MPESPSPSGNVAWSGPVIQVLGGVLIVFLVYLLSLFVMKQDRLVINHRTIVQNSAVETSIIKGYVDSTSYQNRTLNTVTPTAKNYVSLPRSFNRKGGAQFSYSFWVFIDNPEAVANLPILVRGDNRTYTAAMFTNPTSVKQLLAGPKDQIGKVVKGASGERTGQSFPMRPDDIVPLQIACPAIGFSELFDQLKLTVSTTQTPSLTVLINPIADGDDTKRREAMKLIQHKWALFTFVFEDNVAINEFENGIIIRFYLNDILYFTQSLPGSLKVNDGNLYIFPNGGAAGLKLADLTFFNYAIGRQRIQKIYEAGPSRFYFREVLDKAFGEPLYLSEFNKLDIYNR